MFISTQPTTTTTMETRLTHRPTLHHHLRFISKISRSSLERVCVMIVVVHCATLLHPPLELPSKEEGSVVRPPELGGGGLEGMSLPPEGGGRPPLGENDDSRP